MDLYSESDREERWGRREIERKRDKRLKIRIRRIEIVILLYLFIYHTFNRPSLVGLGLNHRADVKNSQEGRRMHEKRNGSKISTPAKKKKERNDDSRQVWHSDWKKWIKRYWRRKGWAKRYRDRFKQPPPKKTNKQTN